MSKNKKLNPIVKWSGGKRAEIEKFAKYIPDDINLYLEPFVGGGAVLFYLGNKYLSQNKELNSVISDVHIELIDFYNAIKNKKSLDIYEFMKNNKNEEENYYEVRDKMKIDNSLDNAKRFYYLRKTCYRGMLRYNKKGKFNIPYGRYKTYRFEDLKNEKYEKILGNSEIICKGFEYIFENYNNKNNFMFLDPPYDSVFTDYGYCKFDKEHHKKLAKCFKETKIRCLMIIGETPFIRELYKDYIVEKYDKKYRFKLSKKRIGDEINAFHLIVKNY